MVFPLFNMHLNLFLLFQAIFLYINDKMVGLGRPSFYILRNGFLNLARKETPYFYKLYLINCKLKKLRVPSRYMNTQVRLEKKGRTFWFRCVYRIWQLWCYILNGSGFSWTVELGKISLVTVFKTLAKCTFYSIENSFNVN